jgi:hypothetical protein
MEPYGPQPSLNLTRPLPSISPYATSQESNAAYPNSNATQPNVSQSSLIQFGIGEPGSAPCGNTTIGIRIGCSHGDTAIHFSGEVVGGSKVVPGDVDDFRRALQKEVNESSVLANSALRASTILAPKHGMSNKSGQVTLASAAKVAAALGADHRRTAKESIGLHHNAEFMTMWGDAATDVTLAGTRKRSQMARTHRVLPDAPIGRTLDELADPNFVPPEVGLPVMWTNPNGHQISLTKRSYLATRHRGNPDQGLTTSSWSPDGRLPSQPGDGTGATTGTRIFAGAGTRYSIPQGGLLPEGSSNLGQDLCSAVNAFGPVPNAVDHFRIGTLTNHFGLSPGYQSLTSNLSPPAPVSDGNTFVPQVDPNFISQTFLPIQGSQHNSPVYTRPWGTSATGMPSAADTQDQARSNRPSLSANTGTPFRFVDSGTIVLGAKKAKEIGTSGLQSGQFLSTAPSGSKSRKPTTSNRSTASRIARPPVPIFRDSQPTSYPDTESSTHIAPSSRAGPDGRASPNRVLGPEDKGKGRKRYD